MADSSAPLLPDIGSQDGIDFLVMEYLNGQTLAERLEKPALPLDHALQFAIDNADAYRRCANAAADRKIVDHALLQSMP